MKVLILCAGRGERLRPLTDKIPKCLIKVGGKPIIFHILLNWQNYNLGTLPQDVCVNLYHLSLTIWKKLKTMVCYSPEFKLMGTAGSIKLIENWFGNHFFVINGDTISNVNLKKMYKLHKKEGNIATIFTHDNAVHCGGTYLFKKDILDYIPKNKPYSIHKDLIPKLIKKKIPITLYKSDAYYFSIDTPQKLAKARRYFAQKVC